MKNKLLSTIVALGLATSLNASSIFSGDEQSDYKKFHNEIIKLFNQDTFFTQPYKEYKRHFYSYPKMNAFENEKNYNFKFEVSGIAKKDIKVTLSDQNILTIAGKKKELTKEEKKNLIRQEHFYGSFSRSVSLPDNINPDTIKVKYDKGVVNVIVQKDMKKIKQRVKTLSID